jgi:uncharacterized protein (DUF1684 family)
MTANNWPWCPRKIDMGKNKLWWLITLALLSCHSFIKETLQYREAYKSEFLSDERSPLQEEDLKGLDFFPPDKHAVVKARLVLTPESQPFELPTYNGITKTYRKFGDAFFKWEKDSARLSIYVNVKLAADPQYADYLFLPFTDETTGFTTYGGGRYLDMSRKDAEDGWLTIDFNHCYNPWCAYSDGYNCPIPPAENDLPFKVEAGERKYTGPHKSRH